MSEWNVIHENLHTKHSVLTAPDEHMPYIIQLHIMSIRWAYYEQMKQQNIWERERERERETETDRDRQRETETKSRLVTIRVKETNAPLVWQDHPCPVGDKQWCCTCSTSLSASWPRGPTCHQTLCCGRWGEVPLCANLCIVPHSTRGWCQGRRWEQYKPAACMLTAMPRTVGWLSHAGICSKQVVDMF